jgi:hypothetical protein
MMRRFMRPVSPPWRLRCKRQVRLAQPNGRCWHNPAGPEQSGRSGIPAHHPVRPGGRPSIAFADLEVVRVGRGAVPDSTTRLYSFRGEGAYGFRREGAYGAASLRQETVSRSRPKRPRPAGKVDRRSRGGIFTAADVISFCCPARRTTPSPPRASQRRTGRQDRHGSACIAPG